jgi:hypothetical protein
VLAELYANLTLCVWSARGSMAEMSRDADYMYPQLMKNVVQTVRNCMRAGTEDGQVSVDAIFPAERV